MKINCSAVKRMLKYQPMIMLWFYRTGKSFWWFINFSDEEIEDIDFLLLDDLEMCDLSELSHVHVETKNDIDLDKINELL